MKTILTLMFLALPAFALTPAEIVVVVNKALPSSVELGEYYLKARGVPAENLISMPLPRSEEMTRKEYDTWLAQPLREALEPRKAKVKCILLMSGVPLRVAGKTPNEGEKAEGERLLAMADALKKKPAETPQDKATLSKLESDAMIATYRESAACVDSELMLLWWPEYPLARWIANPLHWQANERYRLGKPNTLMTARLDGPSREIVKRLIDDAIAVEEVGLTGHVYVDARGIAFDANKPQDSHGYGGYDESMREMAAMYKPTALKVTLDDKPDVFAPKTCPNAALYCGWYSHGKYVDSCTFVKGAVAWHLASSEATTLRKDDSPVWCPNLLKAGVAVTLGPVAEPYSVGFPKPAEFFGFLGTGDYALAEVNAKTMNFASWMMTCVGDPLYRPFKKTSPLREKDLFSSPKGGRTLFR